MVSLFVGFASLFVAPSGEQLALPTCWRETSLPTISRVFVSMLFSGQSISLIPPWEDQCEWHRMTRMTGPDCAVMCN